MKEIEVLRKAMKKARKAWRENKEDTKLKKEFKKRKKALLAAKEKAEQAKSGGKAMTSGDTKKADKKKKGKKKRKASEGAAGKATKKAKAIASSASVDEVTKFRMKNEIKVEGGDANTLPFLSFEDLKFPAKYMVSCKDFKIPTPIQAESWPYALQGRDIIGIAATGSGKTLGFTLPCLPKIADLKLGQGVKNRGPFMLVMSPTRELAQQTERVCEAVCKGCDLRTICVIGGVDKRRVAQELRRGQHVVVATPGRLLGFIREGEISLGNVCFAVLDEADRMLDMGFEPDIRAIMAQVRQDRQTLLFSATWPMEVQKLGLEFVKNPVTIYIGDRGSKLVANARVSQKIEVLEEHQRDGRLHQLLQQYHTRKNKVIVFCLYKKETARVETMLRRKGWQVQSIHGDKSQNDRSACLNRFKNGSEPLLVATDVAARGLDIDDVEVVLNYAFPLTVEDYVHRIGRTGRAGKSGISHTFFTRHNKDLSGELIQVLKQAGAEVPDNLLAFGTGTKRKKHPMYGDHYRRNTDERPMPKSTHITF